ncbi:MAG: MerR family transcriptional regulator [Actinomycetales bacterium]|nr:MerR family transcriptional regulator [Actinomycetales bacterium]
MVPFRSTGGHRLYTRDEVESLTFVREQIDGGLSAADAHRLLAERVSGEAAEPGPDRHGERLLVLLGEADRFGGQMQEYFLRTEGFQVEIAGDDVSVLDAKEAAIEAGADAFLAKPLDPLTLVSTVKDLLGTSAFLNAPGEQQ